MSLLEDIKDFFKTGRLEILPKINVSKEIQEDVSELVEYVYSVGDLPGRGMPSKKYQKHILTQVYAMTETKEYEPLVEDIYAKAIAKENTCLQIEEKEDFFTQMHFAIETLCCNIICLTKDKTHSRKYWTVIDNLSERLLQMDHDKFKFLFFMLHQWHFGYVYEFDDAYKLTIKEITKRLRLYHGIKQTDFYKKMFESKTDIQFALYFGEKAGEIKRVQDKNTYRLYLPEDNITEIPNYEFTRSATTDGDFDYKKYWKDIVKKLKEHEGILQTDFYKLFTWDSEIITRSLRDAEKDNLVFRQRKGNTYLLFTPSN